MQAWYDSKQEIFAELLDQLEVAKKTYPTDNVIGLIKRAIRLSYASNFSEVYVSDEQILIALQKMNRLHDDKKRYG